MPTPFYKRILGKAAKKIIEDAVDMLFNRAKQRLIGPESLDKRIYYTTNPLSLPGLYRAASDSEQNIPDHDLLESVMEVANGYIEKSRQSTKLKIVNTIESFLREARTKNIKTDLHTVLQGQLAEIWQTTSNDMKKIVDTESTNIRNVATLDGIVKINAASGITDPVLYFVVTRDQHLCLQKEELVVDYKGNYVKVKDLEIGDKLKIPTQKINGMGSKVLYVQPKQEEIIHLIFDNGKEIKCTKDHPILVKAGPTYCFMEANRIREDHEVVFLEGKTSRGERYAMGFSDNVRVWMGNYSTAWSFWKENIDIFLESLYRTKKRTEMLEKYNIPIYEWENYIKHIISVYAPNIKLIGGCPNNNFNKKYMDKKMGEVVKKKQEFEQRLINLGGLEWFIKQIKEGFSCVNLVRKYGIPLLLLRKYFKKHKNLLSIVKARGGSKNWEKNRDLLIAKSKERGAPHFKVTSKPETKAVSLLRNNGIEVIQTHQIGNIKVDMFLPHYNVVVEYDGSGHDIRDRMRTKESKEPAKHKLVTKQIDYARDSYLKKQGLRVFRIKDPNDRVPEELVKHVVNFINTPERTFSQWHT